MNSSPHSKSKNTHQKGQAHPTTPAENFELKSLNIELHLWAQTYHEVVKLFTSIIPAPESVPKSSSDMRSILLQMCKDVVKVAENPKISKDYQDLLELFNGCQKQIAELKNKCNKIDENISMTIEQSNYMQDRPEKSLLSKRLSNLDDLLSREIKMNRKYLPSNFDFCLKDEEVEDKPNEPLKRFDSTVMNISSSPRKRKSVFPAVAELLSPSFNDKMRRDPIMQKNMNTSNINISSSFVQNRTQVDASAINETHQSPVTMTKTVKSKSRNHSKSHEFNEEIPFCKKPVNRYSQNRRSRKR
ncbi:hypothetical protein TRFO_25079 [Tritrichomonas foetus]|uniref:Uncharacterized protein n=1 Tax=Tritrichomonas foetus TaxID=1144522 RepID=A0A1J4K7H0_9EUKA|nr:hypothetical protein TRFO_25079 [Tritrichomonas foetus]|eukprot:OHT06832.1 hypothetical protein TRFO_25079 [Tritrichomonas foetus]